MKREHLKKALSHRRPGLLGANTAFAVLCPLVVMDDGQWGLLFELRAATLHAHTSEVCFPGGKMEPGEAPIQTALRETQEELGLPSQAIDVVGELDFIAHGSGFLLHSVLAVVEDLSALCPASAEVDHTFVVPLSFFRQTTPQYLRYTLEPNLPADFSYDTLGVGPEYRFSSAQMQSPIWHYQGHTIWGMSGRIVEHLLEMTKNLEN